MSLDPKAIYIAQRQDDGSGWREVYISGSGLVLQTDAAGYLTGSSILPSTISVLSASYSAYSLSASFAISSSRSVSSSYAGWAVSSSRAISASFSDISISSSFSNASISSSYSLSSSYAVSASRAFLANFALNATTASYAFVSEIARTASYAASASNVRYTNVDTIGSSWISSSAQFGPTDVFNVGTITASAIQVDTLHVQTVTSSVVYSSGSNILGSSLSNTQQLTGSVSITGSLTVDGNVSIGFIDGTSSYALTASYLIGGATIDTSSLVVTASGAINNLTASYSMTSAFVDNTNSTSSGYLVGLPVDGFYGPGSTGSIANIQTGDRVEDALDKVENILFKLAPTRPPNLSSKSVALSSAYSANLQGTNTTLTTVTNNTTPSFPLVGGMVVANAFSDGDTGQLSAIIDGVNVGTRVLTPSDDTGTYGSLQITSDADFYAGVSGKAGFWKALLAQIVTTASIVTVGPHTAQLQHTQTGNTPVVTFYIDDPITPTAVTGAVTATGSVYISGVPALVGGQSGSSVTLFATASNTVGRFYNSTRIFQGSGTGITAGNFTLPSSPVSESVQFGSRTFSVNAGTAQENAAFVVTAYNSVGATSGFSITGTNIRMDSTLDPANRVKSGFGQFGFDGSPFVPSQSIATAVEELQMLYGQFRYPVGNYTSNVPVAGPNYTSVTPGAYNNMRWVTLNMGTITTKTNVQVDFSNAFGFSGALMSNFALYVRVNGSTPTAGWVDGNAAFPGTGNPTNNGDPALAVANSTSTSKLVTFGTATKTGTVFVRIGIPAGDTKRFGGITITAT